MKLGDKIKVFETKKNTGKKREEEKREEESENKDRNLLRLKQMTENKERKRKMANKEREWELQKKAVEKDDRRPVTKVTKTCEIKKNVGSTGKIKKNIGLTLVTEIGGMFCPTDGSMMRKKALGGQKCGELLENLETND